MRNKILPISEVFSQLYLRYKKIGLEIYGSYSYYLKTKPSNYVLKNKKLLGKKTKLKTDTEFVEKLLEQAEVAVVQGSAFGLDGYFRISYATSMDNLKKALERIKSFCDSLG